MIFGNIINTNLLIINLIFFLATMNNTTDLKENLNPKESSTKATKEKIG
jgi:hypothetical protein